MKTRTLHDHFLIVSDPPHGELDVRAAAPCVGLTPHEVRLKANYGVPEIWVADQSRIRVAATAQTLRLAGHQLAVVRGSELLLPPQTVVQRFRFGGPALTVSLSDSSEVEIPYDAPVTGVVCRLRCTAGTDGLHDGNGLARTVERSAGGDGGRPRRAEAEQPQPRELTSGTPCDSAFLDLYVPSSTGLVRVTFSQNATDFTGLGSLSPDRPADNLMTLVRECEQRLVNIQLDRRLQQMVARRPERGAIPTRYSVPRKGYSFASPGLPRLLAGIAPGLDDLSQCELGSRLAYLTASARGRSWSRAA